VIVVLDASGAAEIVARTKQGLEFFNALMKTGLVLAPDLYIAEVSNMMWKLGRNDKSRVDAYMEMAEDCIGYVTEYVSAAKLWEEALRLAQKHDHAAYDMLYAALAKRHDATLITMDAKLLKTCEKIPVKYPG
jgi:predicted nucleic acid-binding protein